jgi:hypothetical protein
MLRTFVISLVVAGVLGACKKDQPDPNTAQQGQYPQGQQPPPGQYPQQQQGQYPQQPPPGQYPQQPPPGQYPQQPPPGTAPAPHMATPGPMALACQNDGPCVTFKCNLQFGKCASPCETDFDCVAGNYCAKGPIPTCLPKFGGQ